MRATIRPTTAQTPAISSAQTSSDNPLQAPVCYGALARDAYQTWLVDDAPVDQLPRYVQNRPWVYPDRPILFFTDLHADPDAFLRSLVLSGGVTLTGPETHQFELTALGRSACFVIGGDCFHKGPSNMGLLDLIASLRDKGADLILLAGNHDILTFIGLTYVGHAEPQLGRFFARLGKKCVPLLREIFDRHVTAKDRREALKDNAVRSLLFPGIDQLASSSVIVDDPDPSLRLLKSHLHGQDKATQFEIRCGEFGLSLSDAWIAIRAAKRLLVDDGAHYRWFFDQLRLAYRQGSFLFVHAGVDNSVAQFIRQRDLDALNDAYYRGLKGDLLEFYHGPLGNVFRTKYRGKDGIFDERGAQDLHAAGIFAIVHGHRSSLKGQRLTLRERMLNFGCDAAIDQGTRSLFDIKQPGAAVTIFDEEGIVSALSADHAPKCCDIPALISSAPAYD